MAKKIDIGGELHSVATDHKVADASEIKDISKGNKSQADFNNDIDRHEVEIHGIGGIESRLTDVEQLGQIALDGGKAQIAQGSDFTNPDATKRAKIPTVGAIVDGLNDGIYDISKRNSTGGPNNDGKFTLEYILNNANTLIPTSWRHGGMTISFIQSSDNKYVQYRLMKSTFSTAVNDWQGVDDEPTAGSNNLVKSGGVVNKLAELDGKVVSIYTKEDTIDFIQNGFLELGYTEVQLSDDYAVTDFCDIREYDSFRFKLDTLYAATATLYYNETKDAVLGGIGNTSQNEEIIIDCAKLPTGTRYIRFCKYKPTTTNGYLIGNKKHTFVYKEDLDKKTDKTDFEALQESFTEKVEGVRKLTGAACSIEGGVVDSDGFIRQSNVSYHTDFLNIDGAYKLDVKHSQLDAPDWGIALYTENSEDSFLKFISVSTEIKEYPIDNAKYIRFGIPKPSSSYGDIEINIYYRVMDEVQSTINTLTGYTKSYGNGKCTILEGVINKDGHIKPGSNYHSDYISIEGASKISLIHSQLDSPDWGAALYKEQNEESFVKFIPYTTIEKQYDIEDAKYIRYSAIRPVASYGQVLIKVFYEGSLNKKINPEDTTFIVKGKNIYTAENILANKMIFYASGEVQLSTTTSLSDYIKVDANKTLYFSYKLTHFAFFTEDKVWIENTWGSTGVTQIEVPSNAKYIRISVSNTELNTFVASYSPVIGNEKYQYLDNQYLPSNIRREIFIGGADGLSFIEGMKLAIKYSHCDVYIRDGVYDISNDIEVIYDEDSWGLRIGKNNHYFFSANSKVICNYSGSNTKLKEDFSPFNANTDDSGAYDFLLDGLNLECSGLRYGIHDEMGGSWSNTYRHIYKNCRIIVHNMTYNRCIGMGLGRSAYVVVDGCYLSSDGGLDEKSAKEFEFHGNYDASTAELCSYNIHVTNNYFANDGFSIPSVSKGNKNNWHCIYSGNSATREISYNSNDWDVVAFNNSIR